ncbi:MAG: MFS transporter, partial [Candidatus Heimdallarchaeota archaeon]|nr:MFS transporter [Candidatus Heimdallarchaeota archaeon]MCK5144853.1 MFS transporter [Candidatus Heimdallarchaeota archaeon]
MPQINSPKPKLALSTLIFGHFLNHFYAYVIGVSLLVIRQPNRLDNLVSIVVKSSQQFSSELVNKMVIFNRLPDLTTTQTGLLITLQMIVFAVITLGVGVVGDKWLRSKNVFVPLGIIIMAIPLFIASYATTLVGLIIAILIVALGASFYHPVGYAMIADLYEEKKGLTMSLNAGLGMAGTAIIPVMITIFHTKFGWRNFFIVLGIICLVFGVAIYFALNKLIEYNFTEEELEKKRINKKSMNNGARAKNWFKKEFLVLMTLAIITCLFYSSFRSGVFRISSNYMAFLFVDLYNFDLNTAGWVLSLIFVIGGLTALLGGLVSDKYTTSLTMLASLGGCAVLLLIIFLGSAAFPLWLTIALYFLFVASLYFSAAAGTKYV